MKLNCRRHMPINKQPNGTAHIHLVLPSIKAPISTFPYQAVDWRGVSNGTLPEQSSVRPGLANPTMNLKFWDRHRCHQRGRLMIIRTQPRNISAHALVLPCTGASLLSADTARAASARSSGAIKSLSASPSKSCAARCRPQSFAARRGPVGGGWQCRASSALSFSLLELVCNPRV